jgi:hypothetical protein
LDCSAGSATINHESEIENCVSIIPFLNGETNTDDYH